MPPPIPIDSISIPMPMPIFISICCCCWRCISKSITGGTSGTFLLAPFSAEPVAEPRDFVNDSVDFDVDARMEMSASARRVANWCCCCCRRCGGLTATDNKNAPDPEEHRSRPRSRSHSFLSLYCCSYRCCWSSSLQSSITLRRLDCGLDSEL
jgi:hypothetical protein